MLLSNGGSACNSSINKLSKVWKDFDYTPNIKNSFKAADLVTESTQNPKVRVRGAPTDHMLVIRWNKANGWEAPKIQPHSKIGVNPASTGLNFGQSTIEGVKGYRFGTKLGIFRLAYKIN